MTGATTQMLAESVAKIPGRSAGTKLRIAYVGWTEPGAAIGATPALQRQLFEDGEFEVLVATDKPFRGIGAEEALLGLKRPAWYQRTCHTSLASAVWK
jgi:hypothetical protein